MLVIDDNMFRLARMQETLLKVDEINREKNLNNYKKTVSEIDTKAFADILEETRHIDEHNQSLEDELQFLERIKNSYEQLLELQLSFKRICELYGDLDLNLSDLSRLNIEYIDNRVNVINGYLVNLKNIEDNKLKLQILSEELIEEEKKKDFLGKKLSESEKVLRDNFLDAEGRYIVAGELKYASVVSEYESLGFDFKELLEDTASLDKVLSELDNERTEVGEKLRTAELCYNNAPSIESKQILDDIDKDFLKVKYRLTMLKILKLLSETYDNYDSFKDKREKLLDLIKYRVSCLSKLGKNISIDPFARTKVKEQLDMVLSLTDNSKVINRMRKEIGQLNARTEEMLNENNSYLISLSDTKALLQSNISINDIDVSSVHLDIEDSIIREPIVDKIVTDNQVMKVRDISDKLNMNIINQKTSGVIKRVNQMMNHIEPKVTVVEKNTVVPELVIVSKEANLPSRDEIEVEDELDDLIEEEVDEELEATLVDVPVINESLFNETDVFTTVVPFEEPQMFVDRTDEMVNDEIKSFDSLSSLELKNIDEKMDDNLELQYNDSESEMPDAFWVMEDEQDEVVVPDNVLSFDEQINALLAENNEETEGKSRKLVA